MRFVRLCNRGSTIPRAGRWKATTSSLLFEKPNAGRKKLSHSGQGTLSNHQSTQTMETLSTINKNTSNSIFGPQIVRSIRGNQKINTKTSKMGGISSPIQLCDKVYAWERNSKGRRI